MKRNGVVVLLSLTTVLLPLRAVATDGPGETLFTLECPTGNPPYILFYGLYENDTEDRCMQADWVVQSMPPGQAGETYCIFSNDGWFLKNDSCSDTLSLEHFENTDNCLDAQGVPRPQVGDWVVLYVKECGTENNDPCENCKSYNYSVQFCQRAE